MSIPECWIALGSGEFEGQVTALSSSGSLSLTLLEFLDLKGGYPSFEGLGHAMLLPAVFGLDSFYNNVKGGGVCWLLSNQPNTDHWPPLPITTIC